VCFLEDGALKMKDFAFNGIFHTDAWVQIEIRIFFSYQDRLLTVQNCGKVVSWYLLKGKIFAQEMFFFLLHLKTFQGS
jgi:hypothetical protein